MISSAQGTQLVSPLEGLTGNDGSSEEEALKRIHSQIPITEKREKADAVVNNSGTIEESEQQLRSILKEWNVLE